MPCSSVQHDWLETFLKHLETFHSERCVDPKKVEVLHVPHLFAIFECFIHPGFCLLFTSIFF